MKSSLTKACYWLMLIPILFVVGCNAPARTSSDEEGPEILTLESSPESGAESIYLTQDSKNQPVAVWTEKEQGSDQFQVLFSRWDGKQFSKPLSIPMKENPKVSSESIPKLIFKPSGEMLLFYEIKIPHPTNDRISHINYQISKDEGNTWSDSQLVHSDNSSDKGHSFFDVSLLPDGEIGAVWLDTALIKGGRAVLFSKTNAENRFGKEAVVDSLACQCCRTALYADPSGLISVVYRDILPGSIRDISVATSTDGGDTFSAPISFSFDQWNLEGCPHNGPDVVSDGQKIYATWFTGASKNGVYFAELDTKGKTHSKERISSEGKNIQLTLVQGKPMAVYSESVTEDGVKGSRIQCMNMATGEKTRLSPKGSKVGYPIAIPTESGGILTAWLDHSREIQKARLTFFNPSDPKPAQ